MKALVVYAHPVEGSYSSALRDRTAAALTARGHEVRVTDLYAEDFQPELSAWEHAHHLDDPSGKPDIARHVADLQWCDTLVLVYPTWLSAQPAMLKGWIDRIWVSGVVYRLPEGGNRIRPLLTNVRHLVVVTTHGSSKFINVLQGEPGKRIVFRSIRLMCRRTVRTHWIALYRMDRRGDSERAAFLDRVEKRLSRIKDVRGR
jgi:putative NADPH-quinone reductase